MSLGEDLLKFLEGLGEEERKAILKAKEEGSAAAGASHEGGNTVVTTTTVEVPKFSNATLDTELDYAKLKSDLALLYNLDATRAGRYIDAFAQQVFGGGFSDTLATELSSLPPLNIKGLSKEEIRAVVNERARLRAEIIERATLDKGIWPTYTQLINNEEFITGASRLGSGVDRLPTAFWFVDSEGNRTFYQNSSILGPVPVEGIANISPTDAGRIPLLTQEDIDLLLNRQKAPPGGGVGARGPTFDRDLVIENITAIWRHLLLEEPANVGKLADNYITEAKAFARRGGSLNLETWSRNQVRETGRFATLYEKKPESQSEDDYINGFRGVVGQFGFNERASTRFIESGLTSGAGLQGFANRVGASRPASLINQGAWSQRFAQSVASLGALGVVD